jgi:hypothetical protein
VRRRKPAREVAPPTGAAPVTAPAPAVTSGGAESSSSCAQARGVSGPWSAALGLAAVALLGAPSGASSPLGVGAAVTSASAGTASVLVVFAASSVAVP